jgi:proliferating cell nuclear antigen
MKFSNAGIWRYIVASISKIIEEGVFKADSTGLKLRALDSTNTALVDLFIPKEAFLEYEASEISLEFPVVARIQPAIFEDVLEELEVVGDVVSLESGAGSSKLVLSSASDIAEARVELSLEDGSLLEYTVNSDSKASYSIEYLAEIARVSPVAEGLTLSYGSNIPLKLVFDISQGGRLTFYVSPRLE